VIAPKQMTPPDERAELLDHLDRCRDLLAIMRDPEARKTIADLIAYLGNQARGDGRSISAARDARK
jgi:hypothetical protein